MSVREEDDVILFDWDDCVGVMAFSALMMLYIYFCVDG
jgi:hypothetical protein